MLKIEYVATDDLIPYINNSRTHSESQVKQIAASIREFGFTNPILIDEEQTIIAGHGRVMAAEVLSMPSLPKEEEILRSKAKATERARKGR